MDYLIHHHHHDCYVATAAFVAVVAFPPGYGHRSNHDQHRPLAVELVSVVFVPKEDDVVVPE